MNSLNGLSETVKGAQARHDVYQFLIERSKLQPRHVENLRKRGFPDNQIYGGFGYFSMPSSAERKLLTQEAIDKFGVDVIRQVPGFYTDESIWTLAGATGLAIPVRDIDGKIQAIKIRADNPTDRIPKYTTLSSGKKENGTNTTNFVHIPIVGPPQCQVIRITEGEFKSDVATLLSGIKTISVPGVASWSLALPVIEKIGSEKVYLAFDADAKENPAVAQALTDLYAALKAKYEVAIEVWDLEKHKGVDDLFTAGEKPRLLTGNDLQTYLDSLPKSEKPPSVIYSPESPEKVEPPTPNEISMRYMTNRNYLTADGKLDLRYWKGNYLERKNNMFLEVSGEYLEADIMRFLQAQTDTQKLTTQVFCRNVLLNVKSRIILSDKIQPPSFIDTDPDSVERFIPLQNGILRVSRDNSKVTTEFQDYSPKFFTTYKLPFDYNPEAKCPIFEKFLAEVQPEAEVRELLRQWFGYNLVMDTTFEKFMIWLGEGSNGKSVLAAILTQMLGEQNVSSIGLEAFNALKTVPLGATHGKLANLIEETDQFDRLSEGLIKNFVSGGSVTVDRKYREPLTFNPTARITLCTNVLPRFSDRSNGLSRRLILVPFKVQIPEGSQDKRFKDKHFWHQSGELSGIFAWALGGLHNLLEQRRFLDPVSCKAEREDFKLESNPAKVFLQEYFMEDPMGTVSVHRLAQGYQDYCKTFNCKQLGSRELKQEVLRIFPEAEQSKNAHAVDDCHDRTGTAVVIRSRVWHGLRLHDNPNSARVPDAGVVYDDIMPPSRNLQVVGG